MRRLGMTTAEPGGDRPGQIPRNGTVIFDQFNFPGGPVLRVHHTYGRSGGSGANTLAGSAGGGLSRRAWASGGSWPARGCAGRKASSARSANARRGRSTRGPRLGVPASALPWPGRKGRSRRSPHGRRPGSLQGCDGLGVSACAVLGDAQRIEAAWPDSGSGPRPVGPGSSHAAGCVSIRPHLPGSTRNGCRCRTSLLRMLGWFGLFTSAASRSRIRGS